MNYTYITVRGKTKIWLILSQILALLSLLPWFVVALMSVMAFDSGNKTAAQIFVTIVWLYPIWLFLFTKSAWLKFHLKEYGLASILSGLTLAPAILVIVIGLITSSFK